MTPGGPIKDNIDFINWCEESRKVTHAGALELGICAAEIDARLRKVSRGLVVTGMSARYRASKVSQPIANASEALIACSRYLITASNRFEAVFMPELEQAGYKGRSRPGFEFKAH